MRPITVLLGVHLLSTFLLGLVQAQSGVAEASIYQYQFVVAITYARQLHGNGVILSKRWILSSASTFYRYSFTEYTVAVGAEDYQNEATWYEVEHGYKHPKYIGSDYNIAVVLIRGSIEYSSRVQPIHLPASNPDGVAAATMLSFGGSDERQAHLRQVKLVLTTDQSCIDQQADFRAKQYIWDGVGYCALPEPDRTTNDLWHTATGAPIVADRVLYAVFAKHEAGDHRGQEVATRIWHFKDWITTTTDVSWDY
ncbi:trypsin-7-like [Anopheles merus]|uniref:Peptidase S1 domain-containing protein n=1 Tax=Anopheles merus TaxID=30066 RepID=A0A182UMC4_ANOME|nr:trypsin-7-like [Anopheles merus]